MKVDVLEGINGRTPTNLNEKALQLASDLKKPAIAGSDAHFSFEIGKTYNEQRTSIIPDGEEEMRTIILMNRCEMKQKEFSPIIQKSTKIMSYVLNKLNTIH